MMTVDSAVSPEQVTSAVISFVKQATLNDKHKQRLGMIDGPVRKTYGPDEISSDLFEKFSTRDAVVWIDPLDGTQDFVNGNLTAVTVLIGLAINGKSRIGIVHKPFSDEDQSKSKTVFGTGEHGSFVVNFNSQMTQEDLSSRVITYIEPFDPAERVAEDHILRVGSSLNHMSAQMKAIIEQAAPVELVRLGGAGNKSLAMTFGKTDAYLYPGKGLAYWDMCAPESIIKGMCALTTNFQGERLTYAATGNRVIPGLIMARSPSMYNLIARRLKQIKL